MGNSNNPTETYAGSNIIGGLAGYAGDVQDLGGYNAARQRSPIYNNGNPPGLTAERIIAALTGSANPVSLPTTYYASGQSTTTNTSGGSMKARSIIILAALLAGVMAFGQSDQSLHVNQFPGSTVGAKVSAAMASCPTSGPCYLIVDASMNGYATGTIPAMCARCSLLDYRSSSTGTPTLSVAGYLRSPVVDVRSYGAKCDGSTDDSAAFNAALATGQDVIVPIGTCVVLHPIYIGGARLEGTSPTGSVIKWNNASVSFPSTIASANLSANVATITTSAAHGIQPNETACIQGVSAAAFNGCFLVASVPTTTTFTYSVTAANATGSGGTAGMLYVIDGHLTPSGAPPGTLNYNAGWLKNFTVQCGEPGISGVFQLGDNGEAENLLIQNCADGYTSQEGYMSRISHVEAYNSAEQGIVIKDSPGVGNGAMFIDSLWANVYGTIGVHVRATPGRFAGLYAQQGGASALYGIFFEGDSGNGAWVRTYSGQCVGCVSEIGAQNAFRIRRYYIELDTPSLATGQPSQDHFVFDDAWGIINAMGDTYVPNSGYYALRSLGNATGTYGLIAVNGGGGAIEPTHVTDFSLHGFNLAGTGWTQDEAAQFTTQGGPSWMGSLSAPTGSCTVGSLMSNAGATSASTALYVCYPANTWTAVTVP